MDDIFRRKRHRESPHLYFDLKDGWRFFADAELKFTTMLEF